MTDGQHSSSAEAKSSWSALLLPPLPSAAGGGLSSSASLSANNGFAWAGSDWGCEDWRGCEGCVPVPVPVPTGEQNIDEIVR
jgi:hypothetical protein